MLIMATDIQHHPRSGLDTVFHISYVGPSSIRIEGPDRPNLFYQLVTNSTVLEFDKDMEQFGPADSKDSPAATAP